METIVDAFNDLDTSQKVLYVVGGVVVAVVSVAALRKLFFKKAKAKKDYPRDTVILHQIGRGHFAPSMTPFAVKLETYLRMARIPYQNVHGMVPSSKGKFPWMEYNGQTVADSTLCINFLNQKLGVDLNRDLSPADRGVAQAMQVMVEEHLYWFLVLFRWIYDNDKSLILNTFKFGKLVFWMIQRQIKKMSWSQGLGRHTEGEITEMFKKDLQSLSDFIGVLSAAWRQVTGRHNQEEVTAFMNRHIHAIWGFIGKKRFLMGDEPCETDCAVFGQLSQVYWQFMGTGHEDTIKDKYPNLAAYCERMKDAFWPDWDQCITHGGTRKATK